MTEARDSKRRKIAGVTDPLGERVRAGAYFGFAMGAVFSVIALLNALLSGGSVTLRNGEHVDLYPILRSYLFFGPMTGALFGAFLPQLRNAVMAYLIGCLVSIPIFLSISSGLRPMSGKDSLIVMVIAVLAMGGPGGLIVRAQTKFPKQRHPKAESPAVPEQS